MSLRARPCGVMVVSRVPQVSGETLDGLNLSCNRSAETEQPLSAFWLFL